MQESSGKALQQSWSEREPHLPLTPGTEADVRGGVTTLVAAASCEGRGERDTHPDIISLTRMEITLLPRTNQ
ncbi:hypothetical protein E2C01_026761 [Portunus trituberculatus]|uniref:Uncharacterized protein n=1 Tax=Portunus trituberculatus TaxID=210409 RepID=A0A5B7EGZ1_PORTR|nr:hypothetical protein [Portunus trituberculatus]